MTSLLKEGLLFGGVSLALLVVFVGSSNILLAPEGERLSAQAAMGAACEMNSFSTGGSIAIETPATEMQKKTCTPISCWQTADGGQKCQVKPAAQSAAGGGGGLLDAIGKIAQMMMGGGGGSPPPPPTPEGTGYVDFQYGKKPICSDFQSSGGNQPVPPGSSVTLAWIRTGGQVESVSITPSIGVGTVESPVIFAAPAKSTTYTLSVSNRSGESRCTVRVFVGPLGSSELSEEDKVFLSESKKTESVAAKETSASLDDPLCKKQGYGDLDEICKERVRIADEQRKKAEAEKKAQASDQAIGNMVYGSDGPVVARYGEKENGYVDPNAFSVDENAFVEDENAFVAENIFETTDKNSDVYGNGNLDALEDQMRALMVKQKNGSSVPVQLGGFALQPDVGVTGSLGAPEGEFVVQQRESAEDEVGLYGRFVGWIRSTFCFWCVGGQQAGAVILSNKIAILTPAATPKPTPNPTLPPTPPASSPAQNPVDTLTPKCKAEHEKKKQEVCSKFPSAPERPECIKQFDEYKHPEAIIPFEMKKFEHKASGAPKADGSNEVCQKVSASDKKCVEMCKEKGYSDIPKEAVEKGKGKLTLCKEGGPIFACRFPAEGDKPPGSDPTKPGDETKSDPNAKQDTGNQDQGGGGDQGGGDQGKGEGGGMPQMPQPPQGGKKEGGQPPPPKEDPCTQANAQMNPKCNPAIPTAPPSCGVETRVSVVSTPSQTQSRSLLSRISDMFTGSSAPTQQTTTKEVVSSVGKDTALTVSPSIIYKGQTATIDWQVTGKGKITTVVNYVTTDEENARITGSLGITDGPTGSVDVSPEYSTTYTLKATNEIGSVTCKPQRLVVRPKTAEDEDTNPETASKKFEVICQPETLILNSGEEPSVEWRGCPAGTTSTFGTSTEDSTFSTGGEPKGIADVKPLRSATYVVRCKDQAEKELARKSCRINVEEQGAQEVLPQGAKPSVDIYSENEGEVVDYGESVRVEWRSKNAASCIIYGPGCTRFGRSSPKCFKEIGRSGFVVGNIYETSEFIAECRGADRKTVVTDTVEVEVHSAPAPSAYSVDDALEPDISSSELDPISENPDDALDELLLER